MLLAALGATVIGFILLIVALVTSNLWLAIACGTTVAAAIWARLTVPARTPAASAPTARVVSPSEALR